MIIAPSNPAENPLIAIQESCGGRFGADTQAENGKHHRHHMDDRFCRIGEDRCRMRHEVGRYLTQEHQQPYSE
jgi:hypothetical protein